MGLFDKVFGSHSDKELKRISKTVDKIEALDESMQKLSDEELRHKTVEFKERLANGETLDDLLPEAYATVREASSRAIGLKHYRVQLIGGIDLRLQPEILFRSNLQRRFLSSVHPLHRGWI